MKKKNKLEQEEQEILKKLAENMPYHADVSIKVFPTDHATLVLVNENELYSVELDCINGGHYLLKLSCPESVKTPTSTKKLRL